jgi:hypothetical protein
VRNSNINKTSKKDSLVAAKILIAKIPLNMQSKKKAR